MALGQFWLPGRMWSSSSSSGSSPLKKLTKSQQHLSKMSNTQITKWKRPPGCICRTRLNSFSGQLDGPKRLRPRPDEPKPNPPNRPIRPTDRVSIVLPSKVCRQKRRRRRLMRKTKMKTKTQVTITSTNGRSLLLLRPADDNGVQWCRAQQRHSEIFRRSLSVRLTSGINVKRQLWPQDTCWVNALTERHMAGGGAGYQQSKYIHSLTDFNRVGRRSRGITPAGNCSLNALSPPPAWFYNCRKGVAPNATLLNTRKILNKIARDYALVTLETERVPCSFCKFSFAFAATHFAQCMLSLDNNKAIQSSASFNYKTNNA